MAAVVKYGSAYGGKLGVEGKIGASKSFDRKAGAFVVASGTGSGLTVMNPATASTDNLVGWAEVPRAAVPGVVDYWTSSTTSGKDKVHIIMDPTAVYSMPVLENEASLTASLVGLWVNASARGTTTTLEQSVRGKPTTTASRAQFYCVGVDMDNRVIYVRINPAHLVIS